MSAERNADFDAAIAAIQLQWGRASMSAERRHGGLSNRPDGVLQWGRASMSAESTVGVPAQWNVALLQWGRASMSAESHVNRNRATPAKWLQWGRYFGWSTRKVTRSALL